MNHIKHLLALIDQFPRVNPSLSEDAESGLDIPKLFRQIRSRYKALCSTLGIRPSLRASDVSASESQSIDDTDIVAGNSPTANRISDKSIWALEKGAQRAPAAEGLSF